MNSPYQPGPPMPPPAPTPKKKGKAGKIVALGCGIPVGLFILIGIIVGATGGGSNTPAQPTGAPLGNQATTQAQPAGQPPVQQRANPEHVVVYSVTGTGKASSITYTTDGMTTINQESDVPLPWDTTIKLPTGQALQMVQLSAQGSGSGKIDVTITVDGKVVKQAHATGYGVASANANIGTMGG